MAVPFLPPPKIGASLGHKHAFALGWITGFILFFTFLTGLSFLDHSKLSLYASCLLGFFFCGWYGFPTGDPRLRRTGWRFFPLIVTSFSVLFGVILGELNYRSHTQHALLLSAAAGGSSRRA